MVSQQRQPANNPTALIGQQGASANRHERLSSTLLPALRPSQRLYLRAALKRAT